ncbi:MAG TPA: hypothetical protein VH593_17460, partial [Ktedonobacteraceae bacterium]
MRDAEFERLAKLSPEASTRAAAVERLARLITNEASDKSHSNEARFIPFQFQLEEGWFSVFLVAAIVYSTIWS